MSLEALKQLSALDGEAKGLLAKHDELLLKMRRTFLNKIVECFTGLTEAEGFRITRDPMGATARLSEDVYKRQDPHPRQDGAAHGQPV